MRLLPLSLLLGALAPLGAAQTTIHVPGDAPTIRDGLALAQDGDTVLVAPGTYAEGELIFGGKAITLKSSGGPETTILDGQFSSRLLRFWDGEGPDSVVEGFTFQNGRAPDSTSDAFDQLDGGAIVMLIDESPTIRECIFLGNRGGRGRSVSKADDGDPADGAGDDGGNADNGFQGGRGGRGGAIYVHDGQPTIERCIFFDNRGGQGGTGGAGGDGAAGGPSGLFTGPGDGGDGGDGGVGGDGGQGGAIGIEFGSLAVVNCLFVENRSGGGGTGGIGGAQGAGGQSGLITQDGDPGEPGRGGRGGDSGDGGTFWVGGEVLGPGAELGLINSSVTASLVGNGGLGGVGLGGNGFNGEAGQGMVAYHVGELLARNSIFWGNATFRPLFDDPLPFAFDADIAYSNLQEFYIGEGNLELDPLWDTAATPAWQGYRIGLDSPCVDAGSNAEYQANVQTATGFFDLTRHIRTIDVPSVADVLPSAAPAIDIGPFEVVAPAVAEPFDSCGVNPADSLRVVSGAATLGNSITVALDNPLGTQGPGSLAYYSVSLGSQPLSPCGLLVPGFGMQGPGAAGEFLLSYAPGLLLFDRFAGVWDGTPVENSFDVSSNPSVLGLEFFAQGLLLDPSPSTNVTFGLTNAVRFVHGE